MNIFHIKGGWWHVMYNGIRIKSFHTRREAKAFITVHSKTLEGLV